MKKLPLHLLACALIGASLCAQNTDKITYQGRLTSGGQAFSGAADLRFALWSAQTAGQLVDGPHVHLSVPVVDGVFSVVLAVDPDKLDGSSIFLQVEVRSPAGTGSYLPLSPRQALTSAPFALKTRGITVHDVNGTVVIGDQQVKVGMGVSAPTETLHVRNRSARNYVARFENLSGRAGADGISIKILNGMRNTNRDNNFITFLDGLDNVAGRIEGFDTDNGDWVAPPAFPDIRLQVGIDPGRVPSLSATRGQLPSLSRWDPGALPALVCSNPQWPTIQVTAAGTWPKVTLTGLKMPSLTFTNQTILGLVVPTGMRWSPGSLPSSIKVSGGSFPSFGFSGGSFPTCQLSGGRLPSVSLNPGSFPSFTLDPGKLPSFTGFSLSLPSQRSVQDFLCWSLEQGTEAPAAMLASFGLLGRQSAAVANLVNAAHRICNDNGVVYGSKGADYAEWLPKRCASDQFQLGQVVGVRAGKVSLDTTDAEQLMVVSYKPIVLGNTPASGEENRYVKVAFMGQIPVVIRGRVVAGDYVVPSNLGDGTAVAIAPENLEVEHLDRIIGRAWEDSTDELFSLVNVVVGVEGHEAAVVLAKQHGRISALSVENDRLREELASMRSSQLAQVARLEAIEAALATIAPANSSEVR